MPKEGKEAWRLGVIRGVAGVVARCVVRDEDGEGGKEKERQATEERKVRFLELFMG